MKTIAKKCKKAKTTTLFPIESVPEGPFAPPLGGRFKLPRLRDRQAFVLSQEGKTQAEIAEKLGVFPGDGLPRDLARGGGGR